jgi:hypothetical protein
MLEEHGFVCGQNFWRAMSGKALAAGREYPQASPDYSSMFFCIV